jgi:glyoxylase-like metal-dependent hydrolase (beta-lactamase superfamily II)
MVQPIRIELPFPPERSTVNVYLLLTPEPVLIDAGFRAEESWHALTQGLAAQGLAVSDLARVIITHPHVDHYGLASRIAEAGTTEVWMSELGVDWLRAFPTLQQRRIDYYRTTFLPTLGLPDAFTAMVLRWMEQTLAAWQPIPPERIVAFPLDRPLMMGGQPWQVLHTPGHDSHLTCFYQGESRHLLAADALMIPTPTPVVEAPPSGERRQPGLPHLMRSLSHLAALEVETVYPGHGPPFGDHRAVIAAQQARIHARTAESLQHIHAGAETVAALFDCLYGARKASAGLAGLWMTVGYVDRLVAEGKVAVAEERDLWRLRVVG